MTNGIGKAILSDRIDSLIFAETELENLKAILSEVVLKEAIQYAAFRLGRWLKLTENGVAYLQAASVQLLPRLEAALQYDNLPEIFR